MDRRRGHRIDRVAMLLLVVAGTFLDHAGRAEGKQPAPAKAVGKTVVLVHGFDQKAKDLQKLSAYLAANGKFRVLSFEYRSRKVRVEEAAASLERFVGKHGNGSEIHLVGFSLGNLVIRRYLADVPALKPPPKIGRVVMIAPPNHGARWARKFRRGVGLYYGGPVVREIGSEFDKLKPTLATPADFGIIAGGKGDNVGFSRKTLPGDDDDYLEVETTKLAGAADFRLINARHRKLDEHPDVHELALRFLSVGFFESEPKRKRLR